MRIILPFTEIKPGVVDAILASKDDDDTLVQVFVGGSDEAYWIMLRDEWALCAANRVDLCVTEHDIVIAPKTLWRFRTCPNGFCTSPYFYLGTNYSGLGCARFRWELLAKHPDVMDRVGEYNDTVHPAKHWCANDARLQGELKRRKVVMHQHELVTHLSTGAPSHGCREFPG